MRPGSVSFRKGDGRPLLQDLDEFWKLVQERGGWWDPLYDFGEWDRVFQTLPRNFNSMLRN